MDFEPIKCKDVETHLAPSSSSVGATRGGPSVRVRNAFCEGHEGPPEGAHGGFGVPEGRSERFCPRPRGRRGSERLPAEGRVAEPPNRRRAPAFPVAGTREARWEPPGVTSACVSPPAPCPLPRTLPHHARSHTPPPWRLGAAADGPARWWRREPSPPKPLLALGLRFAAFGRVGRLLCAQDRFVSVVTPERVTPVLVPQPRPDRRTGEARHRQLQPCQPHGGEGWPEAQSGSRRMSVGCC